MPHQKQVLQAVNTCMTFPAVSLQTISLLMRPGNQRGNISVCPELQIPAQSADLHTPCTCAEDAAGDIGTGMPCLARLPVSVQERKLFEVHKDIRMVEPSPAKQLHPIGHGGDQPGRPRTCCDPLAWSRPEEKFGKTLDRTGRRLVNPLGLR